MRQAHVLRGEFPSQNMSLPHRKIAWISLASA
jgi:hypothetical protein